MSFKCRIVELKCPIESYMYIYNFVLCKTVKLTSLRWKVNTTNIFDILNMLNQSLWIHEHL